MKTQSPKIFLYLIYTISFLFVGSSEVIAQQDTATLWNIVTIDGNEYNGFILSKDDKEIKLKTYDIGTITIQVVKIKKLSRVEDKNIKEGTVWMPNPQESRYFWGPSGYGLRKGESYYQNVWLFFNQFAFGIDDHFSFGFGIIPMVLWGAEVLPVWLTPKFSVPVTEDKLNLGVGGLFGTVVGADSGDGGSAGIVYGTVTTGTRDQNFSFGVGYGYAGDEWADVPTFTISAMVRTGKRGYFMTENYLIDGGDSMVGILSFGGRRIWSGGASLDYGGFIPLGDFDNFVIIPWLGIVIPFGNKNNNDLEAPIR